MKKVKKYRLKKQVKEFLVESLVLSILFITPMIVAIISLKNDFKECDRVTGQTCTIYDLHKVGK